MKYQDRLDLQKTISKLETNNFDYKDIKSILIDLREYSEHKSVFREVSHFVAHKKRDQGIIYSNVEGHFCNFYLSCLITFKMCENNPMIRPEPIMRVAMLFRAERQSKDFYKKHNIQKDKFIRQIKENLTVQPEGNYQWKGTQKFCDIANDIMSSFEFKCLFHSTDLIKGFLHELKRNKFQYDEQKIDKDRLVLIIMVLLHDTEYYSPTLRRKLGKLFIGTSNPDIAPHTITLYVDFELFNDGQYLSETKEPLYIDIAALLITTDLLVKDWCTEALMHHFKNGSPNTNNPNIFLNDEAKLDINFSS